MSHFHFPWLAMSVLVPLGGAIVVGRLRSADLARQASVVICALALALTLGAWIDFIRLDVSEARDPFPSLPGALESGILVLDNLNAPLLPLAALLYLLTAVATLRTKVRRFSFASSLTSLAILLGLLACR